ncbi:hypothetical protein [Dactylosporangium sp. NPDC005555]|uniref:hypothetical protein n=1 Tax=Dactylosporangium sp. NPDC005555 TaxID=3154889 RepID=UPI0033AE5D01
MTDFYTVLGSDFAGKSTVLQRLHDDHGWHVVSYDDRYIAGHPLIRVLRETWVGEAFAWAGDRYSHELVLSVLHPIVLHLRDQLDRATGRRPVVVDSYYYKLLAKCRLLGIEHAPTFNYWRSFPRPAAVVYVDVPPSVAWKRSGCGALINRFEHHGRVADRESFSLLQADLRTELLTEVGDVPLRIVDGCAPPDTVVAALLDAVGAPAVL